MRRTSEYISMLQGLTGIRQVGEDHLDEVHGMYDREALSLERIPGKVLMSSGATSGPIWTLTQMRFQGRNAVFRHEGVGFIGQDDVAELPGQVFPQPTFPIPDPIEWPEPDPSDPYVGPLEPFPPFPPFPPLPPLPSLPPINVVPPLLVDTGKASLSCDVLSLSFDETTGDPDWNDWQYVKLSKTVSDDFPYGGFCYILVTWETDVDWLSLQDVGATKGSTSFAIDNGDVISDFWSDPFKWLKAHIIEDKAPTGTSTAYVLLSAVTCFTALGRKLIQNPDNSYVATGFTVNLKKLSIAALGFVTGTPTNIAVIPSGPAVSKTVVYHRVWETSPVYWKVRFSPIGTWPPASSYLVYDTDPASPISADTLLGPVEDDDNHNISMQVTPTDMVDGVTYHGDLIIDSYSDSAGADLVATDTLRVRTNAVCSNSFTVTVPGSMPRGTAFDVTLQAVLTGTEVPVPAYVPTGDVTLNLNSSDGDDTMLPVSTDNTGWVDGAKTFSCTITGGSTSATFAITASDEGCPTGTSTGTHTVSDEDDYDLFGSAGDNRHAVENSIHKVEVPYSYGDVVTVWEDETYPDFLTNSFNAGSSNPYITTYWEYQGENLGKDKLQPINAVNGVRFPVPVAAQGRTVIAVTLAVVNSTVPGPNAFRAARVYLMPLAAALPAQNTPGTLFPVLETFPYASVNSIGTIRYTLSTPLVLSASGLWIMPNFSSVSGWKPGVAEGIHTGLGVWDAGVLAVTIHVLA